MSAYRVGHTLDDYCAACKTPRRHTVSAASPDGTPLRVVCDYCGSQHNYRGGSAPRVSTGTGAGASGARGTTESFPLVSERERTGPPMSVPGDAGGGDFELLLRRVLREESGLTAVVPADKWRGGEMVLRPGKPGLQEKTWPIETFFHKVVMLRNRLRVLEQQINGADEIPQDQKVKLQSYITACYGSLTSFNILFAEEDDRFHGSGGD